MDKFQKVIVPISYLILVVTTIVCFCIFKNNLPEDYLVVVLICLTIIIALIYVLDYLEKVDVRQKSERLYEFDKKIELNKPQINDELIGIKNDIKELKKNKDDFIHNLEKLLTLKKDSNINSEDLIKIIDAYQKCK